MFTNIMGSKDRMKVICARSGGAGAEKIRLYYHTTAGGYTFTFSFPCYECSKTLVIMVFGKKNSKISFLL